MRRSSSGCMGGYSFVLINQSHTDKTRPMSLERLSSNPRSLINITDSEFDTAFPCSRFLSDNVTPTHQHARAKTTEIITGVPPLVPPRGSTEIKNKNRPRITQMNTDQIYGRLYSF